MLQLLVMKGLLFSTGNEAKFLTARDTCAHHGIKIIQQPADIIEIQDEDPEKVAIDKGLKAFAFLQQPVVISDDSWAFLGLNGFPGVYMHSMNHWFTAEDFLRLTLPLTDRRVIMTQYLVYTDGDQQKVFTRQTEAELLKEIRGTSPHSSLTITSFVGDNGLSIAETIEQAKDKSARKSAQVWQDFAQWYAAL